MKQAIFLDTFLGQVGIAQEGEAITNVFLGGSVRPDAFVEDVYKRQALRRPGPSGRYEDRRRHER